MCKIIVLLKRETCIAVLTLLSFLVLAVEANKRNVFPKFLYYLSYSIYLVVMVTNMEVRQSMLDVVKNGLQTSGRVRLKAIMIS